jgi:hypothetical protein
MPWSLVLVESYVIASIFNQKKNEGRRKYKNKKSTIFWRK